MLLLREAEKTAPGSPDRFVLINGAIHAAMEAHSLRICFDAVERLGSEFDIDELQTKGDAARNALAHTTPGDWVTIANVESLMDLADQLMARDDNGAVSSIQSELQRALSIVSDTDVRNDVRNEIRELNSLREAAERIAPALEKLKKSPEDPSANLAAGSYYCFVRRDWKSGLPLLAKSNSARLKGLAIEEMARPTSSDAVIKLGDGWCAAASTLAAADRSAAMSHAADLYRNASRDLAGLQKLAIESRIARAEQDVTPKRLRRVDLLDYFDPATSIVNGRWQFAAGLLESYGSEIGRVQFAYQPPEEYDFEVSFTVLRAQDCMAQIFFVAGHPFVYQLGGWANTVAGFEFVDGAGGSANRSTARRAHWFSTGRHYISVVKIRKSGVEAYLDGQLATTLKADYSSMSIPNIWRLSRDNAVGVGEQKTPIRFDSVQIIEVSGNGTDLDP